VAIYKILNLSIPLFIATLEFQILNLTYYNNGTIYNSIRFPSTHVPINIIYDFYSIETLLFTAWVTFTDISIENLTNDISVRITSINGIDTEMAMSNGYVKVSVTDKDIRHPRYRFND
jgi:hypothetical protein